MQAKFRKGDSPEFGAAMATLREPCAVNADLVAALQDCLSELNKISGGDNHTNIVVANAGAALAKAGVTI